MLIAIPVEKKALDAPVSPTFGRSPFICIYNTDTAKAVFLDNSAAMAQGGAGIKAAQTLVDNNVEVLLAPRCGQNAVDVLKSAQIATYRSITGSAAENLSKFNSGGLSAMTEVFGGSGA